MQRKQPSSGWRPLVYTVALSIVFLFGGATGAHAQLIEQYFPNDVPGYEPDFSASVVNRMYQQNESQGVEVGDFVVRPELDESTGYNSNTLASPNSGSSELESQAGVRINSDWARDAIGVSINVDDHRYFQVPEASYTNWTASAGGSVKFGDDTATLAYSHLSLNLAATEFGVTGVVTPVPYTVDDARVSYEKLLGHFNITPGFEFENYSFSRSIGTSAIDYTDLSHQTEIESLAGRYETSPGDAVVLIARGSQSQYADAEANNYLDLASFAGLDFRRDPVFQYRLLVGVEGRQFPDSATKTAIIPTFELNAVWTPTELNTITLTGVHRLDDPTSPFARDQDILGGRVEIDHELRQNVFLNGFVEGSRSISQSGVVEAGTDTQTQMNFGVGAVWNVNRHLSASLNYAYSRTLATSNSTFLTAAQAGYPSFNSNIILFGVRIFE